MTVDRRELLRSFGVASATTLLWAFGCGSKPAPLRRAPQVSQDVRGWLYDAVARLSATYAAVHALAVSRHRTTAALDVLGPGTGRMRTDGVVLTVRTRDGRTREHVTSELTAAGVDAAVQALDGDRQRAPLAFGPPPATPDEPPHLDERDLHDRLAHLQDTDAQRSSRIVYAAALIDVDDAIVWSVAPGRDLEQRLVRIRQSITRAAWNGDRSVVAAAEHAWSGWLDDQPLTAADIAGANEAALKLMTPGSFDDGERTVVLDPSVAALLLDAAASGLLTATPGPAFHTAASAAAAFDSSPSSAAIGRTAPAATAASASPAAIARRIASPLITLVDDPTVAGAYGGFAFDDEGQPAAPLTLLDAGRVAAHVADHASGGTGRGRRPGHLGCVEPSPSHLRLAPGAAALADLYSDGLVLEAGVDAAYDPATDRVRLACARARELTAGHPTGRIYADVELVGSLTALLTATDAIAREPASFALGPPAADRDARWRSIATPALRTRGLVRARRSRA